MAGYFSLGGGRERANLRDQQVDEVEEEEKVVQNPGNEIPSNALFLYRNEEIYSKGFELWQQYCNQQRLHHQPQNIVFSSSGNTPSGRTYINVSDESCRSGFTVMRQGGGGGGGGGMNCQDCGNQAKKDCPHMRCRTCCKSRGFQCQTHIKSTWVPASKRRERQLQLAAFQQQQQQQEEQQQQHHHHQQQQIRGENPKRQRENPVAPALATTTSGILVVYNTNKEKWNTKN